MSVERLLHEATIEFRRRFGRPPRFAAAAPGRVNLIGEHTDYHGGFVLPMALELSTIVVGDTVDPETGRVRLETTAELPAAEIVLTNSLRAAEPSWANYARGVLAGFLRAGAAVPPFDALVHSDVPVGGGLSSSAALAVALATFLEAITGHILEPLAKARLCLRAEQDFAGLPCGIMDQFIAVMGRTDELLLIDCRAETAESIPFADPSIAVLVTDTCVRHALIEGSYAQRRAECDTAARVLGVAELRDAMPEMIPRHERSLIAGGPALPRRVRHVITENERTLAAAEAFRRGDWRRVGELMYASHKSLQDDFEVSCEELDVLVELARSIGVPGGVFGSRLTGGGFGGCTVSLVRADVVENVRGRLLDEYRRATGITATSFVSRPSTGTRLLAVPAFPAT